MIKRIINWWRNRKAKKVTVEELYKELRHHNKSVLIKEIIVQAQKNNKNDYGVPMRYKKDLRKYSKKHLIKVAILLRLQNDKKVKRLEKRHNKLLKQKERSHAYS